MRKLIIICSLLFVLSGCSSANTEGIDGFSLSSEQEKAYAQQIREVLTEHYWKYTASGLKYTQGTLPESPGILEASERSGYPFPENTGDKKCVVATAPLLHFNEEEAGLCYFYFSGDALLGVYHTATNGTLEAYGLLERNVFLGGFVPAITETEAGMGTFRTSPLNLSPLGFSAMGIDETGKSQFLVLEETGLFVYQSTGNGLSGAARYTDNALRPIFAAYLPEGMWVVLMGKLEPGSEGDHGRVQSSHLAFFDPKNMNSPKKSILLDAVDDSCVAVDGEFLVLAGGNTIRYYTLEGDSLQLAFRQNLGHAVTDFAKADLDGDGIDEYFMLSGQDAYLYHLDGQQFTLLWQTHINTQYFQGPIYIGDLNGDGAQEIYIRDTSNTSIRYTLQKHGLVSLNEDIDYGEQLIVADFNGDERSDYIKLNNQEAATLYLAE